MHANPMHVLTYHGLCVGLNDDPYRNDWTDWDADGGAEGTYRRHLAITIEQCMLRSCAGCRYHYFSNLFEFPVNRQCQHVAEVIVVVITSLQSFVITSRAVGCVRMKYKLSCLLPLHTVFHTLAC